MRDPLQRLKYLPWMQLAMAALVNAVAATLLEFLLLFAYAQVPGVASILGILFSPGLALITQLAIAVGVGALAVFWLERLYSDLVINTGVLWALVLCVLLAIGLKSLLVPGALVTLNNMVLVGIILGIFWKGRRYWKRW